MLFETADMIFFFSFIFLSLCCTDDSAMQQLVGPIVPRITRLKQNCINRERGRGGGGAMKSGFDGVEWNDGGIRSKVLRWVQ